MLKTAATANYLIESNHRGLILVSENQGGQWIRVATLTPERASRLGYWGFNENSPSVRAVVENAKKMAKKNPERRLMAKSRRVRVKGYSYVRKSKRITVKGYRRARPKK